MEATLTAHVPPSAVCSSGVTSRDKVPGFPEPVNFVPVASRVAAKLIRSW